MGSQSLLPVIEECDNYKLRPYKLNREPDTETWTPFLLQDPALSASKQYPLGYLCKDVYDLIQKDPIQSLVTYSSVEINQECVCFFKDVDTRESRSLAIKRLVLSWIEAGWFSKVTGGRLWRDELYTVYKNPFLPFSAENVAFEVERSAAALFGVVTYGVHLTMYCEDPTKGLLIWVPTRSKTKQT